MSSNLHPAIERVTDRIIERSRDSRRRYGDLMEREAQTHPDRSVVACSNLAHAAAAAGEDKGPIAGIGGPNLAIVTAYNDMLSAHQPYGAYPPQMKIFAREVGATAQVAGGVPAMCDGVTQGQAGMELSLFSRDVIALSTAIALSHAVFDGAALLGICDKIVPGLLIGALRFGHLPVIFVPGGPMPTGLPNREKQRVRQLYTEGKASRADLLATESASFHAPGTCTFYGTANSNQVMMEAMGLHVPSAAFVPTNTSLRKELTRAAVHRLAAITRKGADYRPLWRCVDEKAIINACVALLATGGSTNHAIHLPAMARAAGIRLDWDDLSELSGAVPLIARIYPNGMADVNQFHAAGGTCLVIRELTEAGMMHEDILTVWPGGLAAYAQVAGLEGEQLHWRPASEGAADSDVLRPAATPFQPDGGMRLLTGNLGRAIFKTSAVDPARWTVHAPARIFHRQEDVARAYAEGELDRDVVVIVRFQGPRANGMPELHKLVPILGSVQDKGFKVALVTDGRMSGASGKVPAAIHVSPEALDCGPLALLQDGDLVRVCAQTGELSTSADLLDRLPADPPPSPCGTGRELFAMFRVQAQGAEQGGSAMLAQAEHEVR